EVGGRLVVVAGPEGANGINHIAFSVEGDKTAKFQGAGEFEKQIVSKGDIIAFSTSDQRHKTDIKPIANALEKIEQIGGYTFEWKDTQEIHQGEDIGVIAQEVEKILPLDNVVTTREDGYKAVKYEKLTPLLIEAIKALRQEVQELKQNHQQEIEQLKTKIN
ncbi:tail fiber domain-containing protein, partial [Xanthovirga aplysinae]|uniref:tail fiber domain-containing protein n=1 Tax=Xanthovirga aplysinae TaxID=2529853 RepID=UPI001657441E